MARPRTIVLGFDGLSMIFLKYAMDKGYMPYLSNNKNKFIFRDMYCIPPLTPPSWTSIMTGVNPGKHGIFHFFKYKWTSDGLKTEPVTALDLEHPRIHEALALAGSNIKSIIINPIPSYPVLPVKNSVIMSIEFFTPKPSSHPKDVLNKYFSGSDLETLISTSKMGCKSMISLSAKKIELYISFAERALREDHDLIWLNTHIPDEVFHICRRNIHKPKLFAKIFKSMDALIKTLNGDSEVFLIVSDHGFRYFSKFINVNRILFLHGYLSPVEDSRCTVGAKSHLLKIRRQISKEIYKIIKKNAFLSLIARNFFIVFNKFISNTRMPMVLNVSHNINLVSSNALPIYDMFILLKTKNVAERETLVNLLSRYGITIYKPEDIFSGPFISRCPDLILVYNDSSYPGIGNVYSREIEKRYIAHHSKFGVFIARVNEIIDQGRMDYFLPRVVPNTLPTPFVLKLLNSSISHVTDNLILLKRLFKNVKLANVVGKWKIYKRVLMYRKV